jgi:hypothetical protein
MKKTTRRTVKTVKPVRLPRSVRRLFPQVEYAVDAKLPVEVSVKAKDCSEAIKLNPSECALARAAKRELHADGVIIGISSSYVIKGKEAQRFDTPETVKREIVSFDRHQDFAPGEYYLRPKPPTARLGVQTYKSRNHGSKVVKRRVYHHSARIRVLPKGVGE